MRKILLSAVLLLGAYAGVSAQSRLRDADTGRSCRISYLENAFHVGPQICDREIDRLGQFNINCREIEVTTTGCLP